MAYNQFQSFSRQSQLYYQQQPQDFPKRYCFLHPNKEIQFISTDLEIKADSIFKCEFCVFEEGLSIKNLLSISQIQESNSKTVFWHWPLPEDKQLIEKVRALSTIDPVSKEQTKENINVYFNELKSEIQTQIDISQASMHQKVDKLWDLTDRILEQYGSLSGKEVLQRTMNNGSIELNDLQSIIKEILSSALNNKEQAKSALETSFKQLALQQAEIDFEKLKKIKENVLQDLMDILGEDAVRQKALNEMNTIGKQLRSLNKQPLLENQESSNNEESNQDLTEQKLLMILFGNPTNLKNNKLQEQLQDVLKGVGLYLSSVRITNEGKVEEDGQADQNGLDRDQLISLSKLGEKMKELNEKYGKEYKKRELPDQIQQQNSWKICELLKSKRTFSEKNIKEIEQLMWQYPILELFQEDVEEKTVDRKQWSWIKRDYIEESKLEIKNTPEQVIISAVSNSIFGKMQSGVCEQLINNNLVYGFTCSFNKSLDQVANILIGVINEADIYSSQNFVGTDCYFQSVQQSFIINKSNTIIKGHQLNTQPIKAKITQLHCKFCIAKKCFYIADSTHENINLIYMNSVKLNEKYRFGVQLQEQKDLTVTFSDFIVSADQSILDQF